ncbi:MAG TPA: 3-deoxy-7-phosphoheptulonate synthase [Rectinemataceae bacterium]|nr:3-deoxy-7-phosphoheptulonate synthase [Rectinemataceae bacterium]
MRRQIPLGESQRSAIAAARTGILELLRGHDARLLIVVGPCSLHDEAAALDYGARLARLSEELRERLLLVMRAYPEKSRTALGWRGIAEDPGLEGRRDPTVGIPMARRLLVELAGLGIPLGAELVSPFLWPYWEDCLSWAAVGARGVEAQYLRELAARIPFPVAFKNGLDGNFMGALNAALAASQVMTFIGMDSEGSVKPIEAVGNPFPHVCLRGGEAGPNWQAATDLAEAMRGAGLDPAVLIDLGHGNSPGRDVGALSRLMKALLALRRGNQRSAPIRGFLIESNIEAGRQEPGPPTGLRYGVSITDECLGWSDTESLLRALAEEADSLI